MNMNEYQELAGRTSNTTSQEDKIMNAALGLAGETGEVVDIIKKWKYQGHKLDHKKIAEELGDILWYIAEMADGLEVDLEAIAEFNVHKLRQRYPKGFEKEKSINRKGIAETIKDILKGGTAKTETEILLEESMARIKAITNQEIEKETQETMVDIARELSYTKPISYPMAVESVNKLIQSELLKGKSIEEAMARLKKEHREIMKEIEFDKFTEETIKELAKETGIRIAGVGTGVDQGKVKIYVNTNNIAAVIEYLEQIGRIQPPWIKVEIENKCKI